MSNIAQRLLTGTMLSVLIVLGWYSIWGMNVLLGLTLIYILIQEWPTVARGDTLLWCLTPLYIVLPFVCMGILNNSPDRTALFIAILLTAAFDTGSYVGGKIAGRTLLCPHVSPKKTGEGALGGIVATYTTLYVLTRYNVLMFNKKTVALTLMLCLLALLGDLFESWLKRRAHLKESGTLLPGHGGVLDRVDSHLFAIYVAFILKYFIIL